MAEQEHAARERVTQEHAEQEHNATVAGVGGVETARATVQQMVEPGGCAWHAVQTHESLIPFLIEETAEFVDAIERGLPAEEVAEELGDVLYQVLFHAAIAERDGEGYDLNAVGGLLAEKLRARHPHVFGDRGYMSVAELNAEWERLKEDAVGEQRGSRGPLDGIPVGMPTLARSAKVVERLKRARLLDVNATHSPVVDGQVGAGLDADFGVSPGENQGSGGRGDSTDEAEVALGDAILALVIEANATGLDPDRALRLATSRLAERLTDVASVERPAPDVE